MNIHTIANGPLETNCYIIEHDGKALVIDPGLDTKKIIDAIDNLNLKEMAIVLTHGHYDHIYSVNKLEDKYGCDVYSSKLSQEVINDSVQKYKEMSNEDMTFRKPIKHFSDEMSLLGFNFSVIATPGHSQGSVCFEFKEQRWLIAGDTLFLRDCGRWDLYTGNVRHMWASLEKLSKFDQDLMVYPGHFGGETLGWMLKNNPYIAKFAKGE